jgi:hypothetical protein
MSNEKSDLNLLEMTQNFGHLAGGKTLLQVSSRRTWKTPINRSTYQTTTLFIQSNVHDSANYFAAGSNRLIPTSIHNRQE